jgi:hypothetical protein
MEQDPVGVFVSVQFHRRFQFQKRSQLFIGAHVFVQPKVQPRFLRYGVGDGAGRFIYAGGPLEGSSVTVVPSC